MILRKVNEAFAHISQFGDLGFKRLAYLAFCGRCSLIQITQHIHPFPVECLYISTGHLLVFRLRPWIGVESLRVNATADVNQSTVLGHHPSIAGMVRLLR
jgi:hypothetical protein